MRRGSMTEKRESPTLDDLKCCFNCKLKFDCDDAKHNVDIDVCSKWKWIKCESGSKPDPEPLRVS